RRARADDGDGHRAAAAGRPSVAVRRGARPRAFGGGHAAAGLFGAGYQARHAGAGMRRDRTAVRIRTNPHLDGFKVGLIIPSVNTTTEPELAWIAPPRKLRLRRGIHRR